MTIKEAFEEPLNKFRQITFDGRAVDLSKMSHQHMSNCYWFSRFFQANNVVQMYEDKLDEIKKLKNEVVKNQNYEKAAEIRDIEKIVTTEIDNIKKKVDLQLLYSDTMTVLYRRALMERFNEEILPYKPHPNFEYEIKMLSQMNMLQTTAFGYNIVYNNEKIGEVDIFNSTI